MNLFADACFQRMCRIQCVGLEACQCDWQLYGIENELA